MRRNSERGVTLIELVFSIVIIGIAVGAVLGVLSRTTSHSADAMVLAQAVSIAESYLEEITLKPYDDPDGVDGETARANFDDLDDYNGLVDVGAVDQFGNAIAALSRYTVTVAVAASSALSSVPNTATLRIDVTVSYPAPVVNFTLSAYRTKTT